MKESILKTDKNIVFKETFGSEDLVRANGGTPTAVTFSNGNGSFLLSSASRIFYNKIFSGTGSVRIKCKPTSFATISVLFDFRDNTASPSGAHGYLNATTGKIVYEAGGTIYNRGIPSTTSYLNSDNDIVITGISLSNLRFAIGSNYATLFNFTGSIELFEIYKGTLTANEVKNLYENRQNREINTSQTLQTSTELIVNANDRDFSSGTVGNWNGSFKSSSFAASTEQKYSGTYSMKYVSDGTGAGEVRLSNTGNNYVAANTEGGYITAWVYSSLAGVTMSGRGLANTAYVSSASITINGWQQLTLFVPDGVYATTSYAVWFTIPNGATVYIDDISWKKTLNNTTKEILRVDARNGVIANKYTGSTTGTELLTNGTFNSGTITGWSNGVSAPSTYSITDGILTLNRDAVNCFLNQAVEVIGKTYRAIVRYRVTAGTPGFQIWHGSGAAGRSPDLTSTTWTEYIHTAVCTTATSFYLYLGSNGSVEVDWVKCEEVIPAVTPTAVSVVRSGNVYAMDFNGTTSKIDCGSYDTLVGNKTFVAWVKPRGFGEGTYGKIINNGRYDFSMYGGISGWYSRNDASTTVSSTGNLIKLAPWYFLVVTRTSTGITNLYQNAVITGTANSSGGTPIAGTSNITIGNDSAGSYTFDGQISNVRIIDGILSTAEITQIYQSEKTNYGV